MTSSKLFKPGPGLYRQLPGPYTIRLIVLEPGRVSDRVSIRLQAHELSTATEYSAVSYVWGDPEKRAVIECNGCPFNITVNLYWALVRIRHASHSQTLWVDAICINQSDLAERSHQVSFMGAIFSYASKVYICMGDDIGGNASEVKSVIGDAISLCSADGALMMLSPNHPLRNDSRWHALEPLTRNPWFRRAWVVQEAALSQNPLVLYGQSDFRYRDLITVLHCLSRSTWSLKFGISTLFIHLEWADWRAKPECSEYTFVDLLSHASLLSCSDPRDKVYAFLGHPLARLLNGGTLVKPDYQKDPKQVYHELAIALIQQIGLRVLTTVEHTESTILEDLPSWVIRWDVTLVMNDIYRVPNRRYSVWGGLTLDASTGFIADKLIVRGIILDRVRHAYKIVVSDPIGIGFENSSTGEFATLKTVLEELSKADGSPSAYLDRVDAFCHTLCAGISGLNGNPSEHASNLAMYLENRVQSFWQISQSKGLENDISFYNQARGVCINRSFVVTEKGFYGLAPLLTRPGDLSCVLAGVDVPFVLRPLSDPAQFRLLGESYVHGIMAGEVKGMVQRHEVSEQTIIIR
ncbi:hypothetical protein BP6252_11936 [Coleophoma cylindrospora]|uniref:Heterokaryon incompatibility domain-containing protein n=1 Tax=Coleophoma cylindrospora TaxID=1849047 RepID=A0A3D8QFF3_9HELO|nr:hypothetical protein BP6252_11936 [Coleophoma cylindrospora]